MSERKDADHEVHHHSAAVYQSAYTQVSGGNFEFLKRSIGDFKLITLITLL